MTLRGVGMTPLVVRFSPYRVTTPFESAWNSPPIVKYTPQNFAGELSADGTPITGVTSSIQGGARLEFRKRSTRARVTGH